MKEKTLLKLESKVCEHIGHWKYFSSCSISVIILVWKSLGPMPPAYFGTFPFDLIYPSLVWLLPYLLVFFVCFFFMTYFHIIFCLYRMFHRISSESNIFMYVCFKKCVRRFPVWGVLCSLCVLVSFKGRRLTGNKEQTPVLLLVIQTVKPKARGQRRKLWPWESFTVLPRFMLQRGLLFKGTCLSVCLLVFPTYIWAHMLLTF